MKIIIPSKGIIITTLLFLGLLSVTVGYLFYQKSGVYEIVISNVSSNSFTVIGYVDESKARMTTNGVLYVNGTELEECTESSTSICYSEFIESNLYKSIEVNNVDPDTLYDVAFAETMSAKIFKQNLFSAGAKSAELNDSIPELERIYGRIVNEDDYGIEGALVVIEDLENIGVGTLTAITNIEGTYSISYTPNNNKNFLQDVKVYSPDGDKVEYQTASFWNQPIADIVVGDEGEVIGDIGSSLVGEAFAANSCIKDTSMGGIRIQCNSKIAWTDTLDTSDCPKNESRFRLGVIKHTTVTKFHDPKGVTLTLKDLKTGEFVVDPATGEKLIVKNGGYVETDKVELILGRTYEVIAYNKKGNACVNTDGATPTVVYKTARGSVGSDGGSSSGSSSSSSSRSPDSSGYIPAVLGSANLCSKMGENFAVNYPVGLEGMQKAANSNLRWGEAIITSLDGLPGYADDVATSKSTGTNMILRLCYKNDCNIENGGQYADAVIDMYEQLKNNGQLPSSGIFIHVGHNEPNNAEYRDPAQEAAFVEAAMKRFIASGYISQDPDDIGIKTISPNLDLYIAGDGNWPGCSNCDDPNPHPNYTGITYVNKMMEYPEFDTVAKQFYAWAVNDYLYQRGETNVVPDVQAFQSHVSSLGLSKKIIITELGKIDTSMGWDKLGNTIVSLEADQNVEAILLFNSLGSNKDAAFQYHSDLWNGGQLLSMLSNCTLGSVNIPQEGSVSAQVELSGYSGGSGSAPYTGSLSINGSTSSSGGVSGFGATSNGGDPCLGNICKGSNGDYSVAPGGMLNGNFEGPFVNDGASELNVPAYWHVWYQNGCSGSCGKYSCDSSAPICRRPEYKQSTGFGNRVSSGEASAQWFTSYGTQHAGMYQTISLREGGINTLRFEVDGSSWSDGPEEQEPIIPTFIGRIGIDPDGGINPMAASVQWSSWKDLPNVQPSSGSSFTHFEFEIETDSDQVTVFIAANNEYPYRNSDAYWDNANFYINGQWAIGQVGGSVGDESSSTGGGGMCDPNVPVNDSCTYAGPTIASLCDGGYYDGECYWGETSGTCESQYESCQYIPATDTSVGGYCKVRVCVPDWNGDMDDPRIQAAEAAYRKRAGLDDASGVLGAADIQGAADSQLTLPERGEYLVQSGSYLFANQYISNFEDTPIQIPVFQDLNGDGDKDPEDAYLPNLNDITVQKIGDVTEIDLKPGLSIVSIPLFTEEFGTAEALLDEIIAQGGYATAIGTYRNFGSTPGWNVYNKRSNQSYSDNFEFAPNDAVYIIVHDSVKLKLRGSEYTAPVDAYVKSGWNLIAIKGSDTTYTLDSLIRSLNEINGVEARIASVWNQDRGRYDTYIFDSGSTYGTNIELIDEQAIFIYVDVGAGYWTPDR